MEAGRSRRSRQPDRLYVDDDQSSDSDEVKIVSENKQGRNKNVKKTVRKVKDDEEERLARTLRESGFDCTGMTKEEMVHIAQVVMISKEEAAEQSQFGSDEHQYLDSVEDKRTTEAFQEAVHPTIDLSQDENTNQSNNSGLSSQLRQQPASNSGHTTPSNSQSDPGSQHVLDRSSKTEEAFEEAVHSRLTPDEVKMEEAVNSRLTPDEVEMEEEPIPTELTRKVLNVKPVKQQKQQRKLNVSKDGGKNQTKMDQFSHVIISDRHNRKGNNQIKEDEEYDAVISEDGSSPERKVNDGKTDVEELISEDDLTQMEPDSKKSVTKSARKSAESEKTSPVDKASSNKKFMQNIDDLISDDDSSPVKKPTKNAKKSFIWSEGSDQETQDLENYEIPVKKIETKRTVEEKTDNKDSKQSEMLSDKDSEEEPLTAEFFNIPTLQRHYRNVKTLKNQEVLTLFAPPATNPDSYTKAVVQLFSLYHIRLSQLQKTSKTYLDWSSEPVKVGHHWDHTIDAKKRGVEFNFMEIDDELPSTSLTQLPAKPAAKNLNFKQKHDRNLSVGKVFPVENVDDFGESSKSLRSGRTRSTAKASAEEEIDDFLDTFVSIPSRKSRGRGRQINMKKKSADDFEPFSVNGAFKYSADKGRKRKLYNDDGRQFCPIIEDDDSRDFDMTTKSVGKQMKKNIDENLNIRKNGEENVSHSGIRKSASKGSFKRYPSDLSTGSIESVQSEVVDNLLGPVRPPSHSPEISLQGLSQSSDVLIDPEGQLYSTQYCAMKEKRARTPQTITKSKQADDENEALFQQYLSQQHESDNEDSSTPKMFEQKQPIFNTSSQDHRPRVKSPLSQFSQKPNTTKPAIIEMPNHSKTPETSSLKSRIASSIGSFIKLGSAKIKKENNDEMEQQENSQHSNQNKPLDRYDIDNDDIEEIHVKKEGKTYDRKIGRKRQLTGDEDDEDAQNKLPKIVIPCPLCGRQFPQDKIETHAANCDGLEDENSRHSSVDGHDTAGHITGLGIPGISRVNNRRGRQDEDEDIIIEGNETNDKTPSRADLTCYVCDRVCRSQKLYDLHVEKCLEEAKQVQHQIDTRGLDNMEEEEENLTTPKRLTRQ